MVFMTNMNRFCKGMDLHQTRFGTLIRLAAPQYRNQEKIIAATGVKQVGAVVSAERSQLVTFCLAVSATENVIPPMLIFPRVPCKEHLSRLLQLVLFYLFIYFISIFILLTCRKATEALIHRVGNYPDLLPEMPRYCCPLVIQ